MDSHRATAYAVLILVGVTKWNATAIREEPVVSAGIDTVGLMVNAKDLRTSHYDDYTMVFN
jgi:hypothetical protein